MYLSTRTQRGLFVSVRTGTSVSAFGRQSFVDGRRFYRPSVRSRHSQSYDDRRAKVSAQLRLIDSNRILQSLPCICCHGGFGFGLDHLLPRSYHLKQIEATASNVGKNVTFIEMQFEAGLI